LEDHHNKELSDIKQTVYELVDMQLLSYYTYSQQNIQKGNMTSWLLRKHSHHFQVKWCVIYKHFELSACMCVCICVKSSHFYLSSTFHNTDCIKAASQW